MIIKTHRLPDSFLKVIASGLLRREAGTWPLRSNFDAFGQPLEAELAEVYDNPVVIERETARLPVGFKANGAYGESLQEMAGPSAIPDIVDFEGIVCFGISGDGAPFCLDYRGGYTEPPVIWWDDVYWRTVAPDFASFLSLFNLHEVELSAASDPDRT